MLLIIYRKLELHFCSPYLDTHCVQSRFCPLNFSLGKLFARQFALCPGRCLAVTQNTCESEDLHYSPLGSLSAFHRLPHWIPQERVQFCGSKSHTGAVSTVPMVMLQSTSQKQQQGQPCSAQYLYDPASQWSALTNKPSWHQGGRENWAQFET